MASFGPCRTLLEVGLLADAKLTEDQSQDVIARGVASEGIESLKSFVKIEKN